MTTTAGDLSAELSKLEKGYELIGELSRDEVIIVFVARDRLSGNEVTVKVLRAADARGREGLAHYASDARMLTALEHPNIVTVHAVKWLSENVVAVITERVRGPSLRQVLDVAGTLPVVRATEVLKSLGRALAWAHSSQIMHRDLRPENVIFEDGTGRVVLSDFGLARRIDAGDDAGDPYRAPELADGRYPDRRTDVYSLGIVGWELLTGRRPWPDAMEPFHPGDRAPAPPPLAAVRPGLPEALVSAIEGAVQLDRDRRIPDVSAFLERLTGVAPPPRPQPQAEDEEADEFVVDPSAWVALPVPKMPPRPAAPATPTMTGSDVADRATPVRDVEREVSREVEREVAAEGGLTADAAAASLEPAVPTADRPAPVPTAPSTEDGPPVERAAPIERAAEPESRPPAQAASTAAQPEQMETNTLRRDREVSRPAERDVPAVPTAPPVQRGGEARGRGDLGSGVETAAAAPGQGAFGPPPPAMRPADFKRRRTRREETSREATTATPPITPPVTPPATPPATPAPPAVPSARGAAQPAAPAPTAEVGSTERASTVIPDQPRATVAGGGPHAAPRAGRGQAAPTERQTPEPAAPAQQTPREREQRPGAAGAGAAAAAAAAAAVPGALLGAMQSAEGSAQTKARPDAATPAAGRGAPPVAPSTSGVSASTPPEAEFSRSSATQPAPAQPVSTPSAPPSRSDPARAVPTAEDFIWNPFAPDQAARPADTRAESTDSEPGTTGQQPLSAPVRGHVRGSPSARPPLRAERMRGGLGTPRAAWTDTPRAEGSPALPAAPLDPVFDTPAEFPLPVMPDPRPLPPDAGAGAAAGRRSRWTRRGIAIAAGLVVLAGAGLAIARMERAPETGILIEPENPIGYGGDVETKAGPATDSAAPVGPSSARAREAPLGGRGASSSGRPSATRTAPSGTAPATPPAARPNATPSRSGGTPARPAPTATRTGAAAGAPASAATGTVARGTNTPRASTSAGATTAAAAGAPRTATTNRATRSPAVNPARTWDERADGFAGCSSPALADQRACIAAHLARNDAGLNQVYNDVVAAMRRRANTAPGDPDPPEVQRLRAAQRSWIARRDAECRQRGRGREGPLWAPQRAQCLEEVSLARARDLSNTLARLRRD